MNKAEPVELPARGVVILSASVRDGRNSHRVALFLQRSLAHRSDVTISLIDLRTYDFPIFHERLARMEAPPANAVELGQRITGSQGVIIVTPEYNGGIPASLKNAIDLLHREWRRKPVALATVSDGSFGGSQVLMNVQFILWKIGAWTVSARFPVPDVADEFDEDGTPKDPAKWSARANRLFDELLWAMEANERMKGV